MDTINAARKLAEFGAVAESITFRVTKNTHQEAYAALADKDILHAIQRLCDALHVSVTCEISAPGLLLLVSASRWDVIYQTRVGDMPRIRRVRRAPGMFADFSDERN